jgi:hypothetical protein
MQGIGCREPIRAPNIMKHTLRCHGFGDVEHAAGSGAATGMHRAGNRGPKPCQPTRGLRPESSARRSVGQGSAQRGAGARLRDATVEPIKGASFQCRSPARLRGQIPRGAPLPPLDAPRFPGMRPRRRAQDRGYWRAHVPLRGRIQAHTAWNLLRPPRDLCREACQYSEYWLHLASRYRRF